MKTLFSALYFALLVDLFSFLKNIHNFISWVFNWCSTDTSGTENWEINSPTDFLCQKVNITILVVLDAWGFLLKTCLSSNLTGPVMFMKLKHTIPFLFITRPEYMYGNLLDMSRGLSRVMGGHLVVKIPYYGCRSSDLSSCFEIISNIWSGCDALLLSFFTLILYLCSQN